MPWKQYYSIPNSLSFSRLLAVPLMVFLAFQGYQQWFMVVIGLMVITDLLDGLLARLFKQESEFGSKLDSIADLFTCYGLVLSIWYLWPEQLLQQKCYILLSLLAYLVPIFTCLIKFHRLPSFHTWSAKLATAIGLPVLVLWIGFDVPLAMQLFAFWIALIAIEYTLIVLLLTEWQSNVTSVFHIKALK